MSTKADKLKPRLSKIFSDLWDDKVRTTLVVASISVGVFALGMVISAYAILDTDVSHSYASINPPNIEIWTDPFDDNLVHSLPAVSPSGNCCSNTRLVWQSILWLVR